MRLGDGIANLKQTLGPAAGAGEVQATHRAQNARVQSDAGSKTQADEASLSTTGGLVAKVLESSDVRIDKVEAVRQAIADGSYKVSSGDVADKIIQSLTK